MLLHYSPLHILSVIAALRLSLPVQAIKGDSGCGYFLCVNATLNEEANIINYELTALNKPFGWVGIGWGSKMDGADMVIMWKNLDGSTTLAQRRGMGHFEPLPVEYPARRANITEPKITAWHPSGSTTLGFSVRTYTALLEDPDYTEHLIWAYSMTRPDKDTWSELMPHYTAGFFRLKLHKELPDHHYVPNPSRPTIDHTDADLADDANPSPPFYPTADPNPLRRNEKIIIAHGVIASLGFLVILPAGALFARWARALTPKWFKAHQTLMLVAMPVITIGWVLGPIAVMARQATHLFDAHQVCGVILVAMYYLQMSLGRYIHRRRSQMQPGASSHPPSNILHIVSGITIVALAFFQVRSGLEEWRRATGRTDIASWCHDLWQAWVVIVPFAYILGAVMLPRQLYQEKSGESYVSLSVTPPVFEADDETYRRRKHSTESIELTREIGELETNVPLLSSR
ncbi:hypothetical protein BDZ94DRAFT_1251885 [Collybia nuda]|uniref:Cytochrome b561 domain-containing protein n=1 Tax=Collybia nuda TaxID=64659 RepID=A0A9P5YCZ8_9AGAR|nr:hypothetical protein BDZ94DRAFT_1251885 [Collybia nuda]